MNDNNAKIALITLAYDTLNPVEQSAIIIGFTCVFDVDAFRKCLANDADYAGEIKILGDTMTKLRDIAVRQAERRKPIKEAGKN